MEISKIEAESIIAFFENKISEENSKVIIQLENKIEEFLKSNPKFHSKTN
jgi:hypothetical protein